MRFILFFAFGAAAAESLLSGSASVKSTDAPALSGAEPLASEYDLALSATVTALAADASSYDNPESLAFDPESLAFDRESLFDSPESLYISSEYMLGEIDDLGELEDSLDSPYGNIEAHPFESIRAELTALPLSLSSSIKQPALPAEIIPPSNSCQIYTLRPGDSCWFIARTNSITMEQLAAWNPDMSCTRLLIGQRVCVTPPSNSIGPSPTQPGNACREYVVKSGDSCWYIGASIGISLEQLQAYNPGLNCQGLQVGQRLCLPPGSFSSPSGSVTPTPTTSIPVTPSSCKLYTVVSGDSCYDISLRTQVYLVDLLSYNPDIDCNRLYPGQVLCLSPAKPAINKLAPDDKGVCAWHRIRSGETCTSIGQPYGIGADEIEGWNRNTWRWSGCKNLQINTKVCLSPGIPPLPDANPQVECGLESKGNLTCAFNLCCSMWGFCGFDDSFCAISYGPPGTGCQSNCNYRSPL